MARSRGIRETKPRNTVARKQAALEAERGITPLEVLLQTMREEWDKGNKMLAAALAEKAAPYLHPKLASTTVNATVRRRITDFTDEELDVLGGADGEGGEAEATAGPH